MKTVLIVDDEQVILDVLERILRKLGYRVLVADSGDFALELFSEGSFDVVFMDVLWSIKHKDMP